MNMLKNMSLIRQKKILLLACKIALGSSFAIYTAELLDLEYSASAGIVALLTLITTRKGTLQLSVSRLVTFAVVALITSLTFLPIHSEWIAYGLFTFLVVWICETMQWRATISVNAVIGTHFLMARGFSPGFFLNEFLLVAIGIFYAFILNLFHNNRGQEEAFSKEIEKIEQAMKRVLEEIAKYLSNDPAAKNVWNDLRALRIMLTELLTDAREYEGNAYGEGSRYYIRYFEMRLDQCRMLHNLQSEMQKIKSMPSQAEIIVEYIRYMSVYVTELNEPTPQLQYLDTIFQRMKEEPLPVCREEFESRAVLYHILMDLEEFLLYKQEFVRKEVKAPAGALQETT